MEILVTFWMHDFWAVRDPMQRTAQMVNFTKNLALLGAALTLLAIPRPWPMSLWPVPARGADEVGAVTLEFFHDVL